MGTSKKTVAFLKNSKTLRVETIEIVMVLLLCRIVFCSSEVPFFLNFRHCSEGSDCEKYGLEIENSINKTHNPCENFYTYACGRWIATNTKPRYEPIWNQHLVVSHRINKKIQNLLESTRSTQESLLKAKLFYNTCTNTAPKERKYLNRLKIFIDDLDGWPLADENWSRHEESYDWLKQLAKISRILGIHPILKLNVNIDYKDTKKYVLYIEPGNLIFPSHILLNHDTYPSEMNAYKQWIFESLKHMYFKKVKTNVKLDILKIIKFEIDLAKIMGRSKLERTSIRKLSSKYPGDWLNVFNIILYGCNSTIKLDDTVVIRNYNYLKQLFILLQNVEKKTIANYLTWNVVRDLSRETTKYMRNLNFLVDKAVLGVSADLSRKVECINKITEYFSFSIVPEYIKKHTVLETVADVELIINKIKTEFQEMVENSTWLSNHTRVQSIEKIKNIKGFVGFPDWAANDSLVEEYYQLLEFNDDHFLNMMKLKNFKAEKELFRLQKPVDSVVWPSSPFDVNAYYSILQNSVFIPLGIMEPPFYSTNRPRALNYGALGSLIGHEISHSLDTTGRLADKNGIISKWWLSDDIFKYQEKTKCFGTGPTRNSIVPSVVGENIADYIGFEISLQAFKKLQSATHLSSIVTKEIEPDKKMFYISYAQMWCELPEDNDLFESDEHAPVIKRVNKTVYNSEEFVAVFQCAQNIVTKKCRLW